MVSILIPVFDFDVRQLVHSLWSQISVLTDQFEIICIDDASPGSTLDLNRSLANLDQVHWMENNSNQGRSAIRNQLAERARYPFLLFLDCDSAIIRNDFVQKYLDKLPTEAVLIGGRRYGTEQPDENRYLHWLYGTRREQRMTTGFHSNNFLIAKDTYQRIRFDEDIQGYGHEDTLFGFELERQGIPIENVDNPILHLGLEDAPTFLRKQEAAINNLIHLEKDQSGIKTRLGSTAKVLRAVGISDLLASAFRSKREFLRKKLSGPNPSLFLLDLYKIGYYLSARLPK